MLKRMIGMLLVCIIAFNCFGSVSPVVNVYAFSNFDVEVIKDNAPLRDGYYESEKVIKRYSKGTVITVVGEKRNLWGNLWYKIKGGGYIYSENVKKTTKKHEHSYKLVKYENAHPHYANYECSCGSGYCGTDTKKVNGCSQCYPHEHSYKLVKYESAHPHYANYECSCGSGYCGKETTKKNGCSQCYPHEHSYKLVNYESAHPHYANYECSCGSGYCGKETTKKNGCSQCYPHEHSYKLVNYESAHPHYANYECSCGSGYCGKETKKMSGCDKCYEHECSYELVDYEEAHPHYAIYECSCGSGYCGNKTKKFKNCKECYQEEVQHEHSYKIVSYESKHPHYANYECSCGSGYCGTATKKIKNCNICYPKEEDEQNYGHECYYIDSGMRRRGHPHYVLEKCKVCGKTRENREKTEVFSNCFECINNVDFRNFNSPFNFGLYDVSANQYVHFRVQNSGSGDYDVSGGLHTMLDICGLAPAVGMVCDGINVLYYLVEGDIVNAGISGVAFFPYVGIASTSGKLYSKAGTIIVDTTSTGAKVVTKATSKVIIKNPDLISDTAGTIIKNYSKYSDDVLETVGKISRNETVSLGKVYHNKKLLISKEYSGTIISPAGLKYSGTAKEGHRLHHVLERHGANLKGTADHGTLFNVDGKELFDLIDDVYSQKKIVGAPVLQANGNTKVVYQASKKVGLNGETKIEFILRGDELITAYPVK